MTQEERISRIWFVTFASSNAKRTLRRICRQAVDFGFAPSRVNAFSERDLAPEFFAKMELRLRKGVRGFGYWCWEPQIVLQALQRMPDGDEACRSWGEMNDSRSMQGETYLMVGARGFRGGLSRFAGGRIVHFVSHFASHM